MGSSPQRNTDVGALVNVGSGTNAGMPLFEVSDLHKVRIYVQAPQAFTGDLKPGLKATFDMPQYPGRNSKRQWPRFRTRWTPIHAA